VIATLARGLHRSAAGLVFLSLLVGALSSFALSGQTGAFDGRTMLGAHVTGLIGACLMFGLAASLPQLRYGASALHRLAQAFAATNYANVTIGAAKSFFFVHGVGAGGSAANNIVFGLLTVFVVVPSLACAFFWAIGFTRADASSS
jgi:(hydroxyamino)benzene mutase